MGLTISGTQTVGVHLTSASQNPVSVTSTGAIITTGSYAIYGSRGPAWTITNDGSLSGSSSGIIMRSYATINNYGTVAASSGTYSSGVALGYGGTITNLGRIYGHNYGVIFGNSGGDALLTNGPAASIKGDAYGVAMFSNLATAVNLGSIIATSGPGLTDRFSIGTIANGSRVDTSALISGGSFGISLDDAEMSITNYGTISGSAPSGIGIYSAALGAPPTVVNAGTIIGAGGTALLFEGGGDLLVMVPHSAIVGGVTAGSTGATTNTLELAASNQLGVLRSLGEKYVDFNTIAVDAGARWRLSSTNTLAGGSMIADNGVLLAKGSLAVGGDLTLSGNGVLATTSTGEIEVGAKGRVALGRLVVDGGRKLVGTGTIRGPITVSGQLRASGGTLTLAGNDAGHGVIGGGAVEIDSGSVLIARNEMRERHVVFLAGTNETLGLNSPGKMTSTISGFGTTDTIDLLGITATGSFANGVLTLTGPHGGHAALHFAGSYASGFTIGSDGHGGTAITVHA